MTQEEGLRAQVEEALNKIERAVSTEIETGAFRVKFFEVLRYLAVVGDSLLYLPDEGGARVYRLDQYVVRRDPMGNPIEIITKEQVYPSVLPDEIREDIQKIAADKKKETVEIYTRVLLNDSRQWEVYQECEGIEVPGTRGTYPYDECPWLAVRWTAIDGEDYGRSIVEEYLGDLMTLEALTKAITEGSLEAARIIHFVNPSSVTNPRDVAQARTGDVLVGNAGDVTTKQLDKYADFRIAAERIAEIEERLSHAFLMMESIQRHAERVTAEEIRVMARELEDSLGGVYSVLSQELQLPIVKRLMAQMARRGILPDLPKDTIKPMIVTGIEALGRGQDLTKIQAFLATIAGLPPALQQEVAMRLNAGDIALRVATSLGIDASGMLISEQEYQMKMQAMALQAMGQAALPGMAQEITKGVMQSAVQGQGPGPGA